MSNKLSPGFVKADSNNLPRLNSEMINDYFVNNSKFVSAEVRHKKTKRAADESYGDNAICYVEVRREGNLCFVQGKITPEHKIKKKAYVVKVVVDEKEEEIISGDCLDCAAAKGGCKHCVAFLLWIHRRSEEPSVTSTQCYWKSSKLAKADVVDEDIATILGNPITFDEPNLNIVKDVVSAMPGKNGVIFKFFEPIQNEGSIHYLLREFLTTDNIDKTADNFATFAESLLNDEMIDNIEKNTRQQSNTKLWYEMRFGRVTASIIYEVARCKTVGGTLMEKVLGAEPPLETEAVVRGRNLECEVINAVCESKNLRIDKAGLFLIKEYPMFGASPDGISEDYVIEVKCPFSTKSVERYLKNGVIQKKFYYQLQLQMLCAKKQKGLFCVASPTFEQNKEVDIVEVNFDREKLLEILELSKTFWVNAIFPQLLSSYL